MNMKLTKAFRDLIVNPKRTFLVIFALILGIWGVGTILVSYFILTNDLNANYQSTHPAHLILKSEKFNQLDLAKFKQRSEVETAELRDFSLHRIEVYPDVWIPLWLYGVEDFEKFEVAHIFYESGKKTPDKGTILMERNDRKISNLDVGVSTKVRIGNQVREISISGICFDPAQAPATQDAFIYAYTDKGTYTKITGKPHNQRLIVRLNQVNSAQEVKKVADILVNDLNKNGIKINSIDIPKFNEHPHQWQLDTLLLLIGSIGFLAFLMSGVLVSQLMKSIIASQIRQIGILKAVGASRHQVFQIFTVMLLLMGLTAGIIATPLAISAGNAFAYFVAGILNFNILTTSIPIQIYVILLISSLLLPLLLSLVILLKGTSVSVKAALSDYGIAQNIPKGEIKSLKILPLSNLMLLAIRNSFRNSRRLVSTILTMALGVAIFSTGFNVKQSLWELLESFKNELRYDVQVVLNQQISREEALKPFKNLKNVERIEMWTGGRGEIQSKVIATNEGVGITALPYNTSFLKLKIVEGTWLQSPDRLEVVINQQAWAIYKHPKIGTDLELTIGDKKITTKLVGIAEQFEKPKMYLAVNQYDSLFNPKHHINSVMFVAKDNSYKKVIALKKEIENALMTSDLNVLYVMSQAQRVKIIYDHLDIILTTIVLLSFLVLVVSAIGMASAMSINIWERTREIGVMRAIGASPQKIYTLFVNEGLIISGLSIILGLLFAYPLSKLAAVFFGNLILGDAAILQYAFSPLGFWVTLVVTFVFGWLASRIPAQSAIKIPTHTTLSYE